MTYFEVINAVEEMVANGTFNYVDYLNLVEMNIWTYVMFLFSYSAVLSAVILSATYFIKKMIGIIKDVKLEIEEGEMNY